MARLSLSFECKDDSLSVRRFSIREKFSTLFQVDVWARSERDDIDFETMVGKTALLRVESGIAHVLGAARVWSGVCNFMEQEETEETGLSTYHLRIVPTLWLLTQRKNYRIFQHRSIPEITETLLREWHVDAVWNIDRAQHPKLEYRVQYGESDFDFLSRLFEEAGISFTFSWERAKEGHVVLLDNPQAAPARAGGPITFVDNPNEAAEREFVTRVRISQEVRPGKLTLRDHDFRRRPDYSLFGHSSVESASEERFEHVRFMPGSFVVEGNAGGDTPVADDKGTARADEKAGIARAERMLRGERGPRTQVTFRTNALDLKAGAVFAIDRHPRPDLNADKRLLVTEFAMDGTNDGAWETTGRAVFANERFTPAKTTTKPQIHGVQSAVVVGPKGEEIHTDEFGRVRVQFHWDREGRFDDGSSCWMRVSQGWAGSTFGALMLPRVGQEVLVGFLEGDPDQPIVMGRVFNATSPVPYKLPENKAKSTWRSDSTPGSEGFNEIMFDDAKGHERVFVQAERNLDKLVKKDETITVGKNRYATVGIEDASAIGAKHSVSIKGTATGTEMVAGRISLTTGAATITLDGPNITLDAGATITLNAGADVVVKGAANISVASGAKATVHAVGGDLVLQGGPMVRVNPTAAGGGESTRAQFRDLPMVFPPEVNVKNNILQARKYRLIDDDAPAALFDKVCPGGEWDLTKYGKQYEDASSVHLGLVGRAAGLPAGVLLRYAGKRRLEKGEAIADWGNPGNGLWGGEAPYGESPRFSKLIKRGCDLYKKLPPGDELKVDAEPPGVPAVRLSDFDGWEFHCVGPKFGETGHRVISLRPYPEFGQAEFGIWRDGEDEPYLTGSVEEAGIRHEWNEEVRSRVLAGVVEQGNADTR